MQRLAHTTHARRGGKEDAPLNADVAVVQRQRVAPRPLSARRLVRFVEDAQPEGVLGRQPVRILRVRAEQASTVWVSEQRECEKRGCKRLCSRL